MTTKNLNKFIWCHTEIEPQRADKSSAGFLPSMEEILVELVMMTTQLVLVHVQLYLGKLLLAKDTQALSLVYSNSWDLDHFSEHPDGMNTIHSFSHALNCFLNIRNCAKSQVYID